jgi:hypothetical protein
MVDKGFNLIRGRPERVGPINTWTGFYQNGGPCLDRPDGRLVKDIPNYRKMMPLFMRTKAESLDLLDVNVRIEKAIEMTERLSKETGTKVTLFHLVLHTLVKTLYAYPRSNRFCKGGRHYQRDTVWLSFSVKKEMTTRSKIAIVKKEYLKDFTVYDTIKNSTLVIKEGKDHRKDDAAEKETRSFLKIPHLVIRLGYPFYKFADDNNLLPGSTILKDPMYASAFLANVGSFDEPAGYHHLYEIGTIGLFFSIGRVEDRVLAEDGKVVIRKVLPIKLTFDERVEDGMYCYRGMDYFIDQLENPEKLFEPVAVMEP